MNDTLEQEVTDPFRNIPERIVGYAHVIGSTLRALPANLVRTRKFLTGVTVAFVAFDVFIEVFGDEKRPWKTRVLKGADATLWHGLATVAIPSVVAQGSAQVPAILANGMKIKSRAICYVPLGLVLLSLPLLANPIDRGVDSVLDNTTRPIFFPSDVE